MANATSTQLQELYVAYFGRAADPTGLDYWKEKGISTAAFAANMYAQPEFKSAYGDLSIESQVNQIYKNLFDRDADVAGLTYWTQQIRLGNLQLAEIANDLIYAAQNNAGGENDKAALANRTNAAIAYTAKIKETTAGILAYQPLNDGKGTKDFDLGDNLKEAVSYLSGIDKDTAHTDAGIAASVATINENGVPTPAAKSYTLTSNTDTFSGSSGKDVYQGVFDGDGTGTGTTATSGDSISGEGGVDTFNLSITGDSGDTRVISGINADVEKILVSNFDLDAANDDANHTHTFDAALSDGVTTVGLSASSAKGDTIFTNLKSLVNAEMSNGAGGLTVTHADAAVKGSADSMTLTVSGQTAGDFIESGASAGGIETLNVVTKGSASTVNIGSSNNTLSLVNFTGDQNVTSGIGSTALETIDASTFTGKLDVSYNSAVNLTVKGGTNDDTITFGSTNTLTSGDVIDGGAGTDTLEISDTITEADLKNVSNVETLKVTGNYDVTLAGDATIMNFDFTSDQQNILTLNAGVKAATTVTLGSAGGGGQDDNVINSANVALTIKGKADAIDDATTITGGTGTDTIEITADTNADVAIALQGGGVSKIDKIVVVDGGDKAIASGSGMSGKDINITTGVYTTALTIDGSALDAANYDTGGNGTISSADGSEETLTVDGSSATAILTITGGAGTDTITSGTKNDVIDGGAGNDTITSTGGNDNIKGGAGDDTFKFTTTLTKDDVVDGGDGTDKLIVTALDASALTGVTNVETLAFSGSASIASDLSFTTIDLTEGSLSDSITFASGYAASTTVKVDAGDSVINGAKITLAVTGTAGDFASGDNTIVTGSSSTKNDSITITADGSTVVTSGFITNVNTITIADGGDGTSGSSASGDDFNIDLSGYATALTIDASALDFSNRDTDSDGDVDKNDTSHETFTISGTAAAKALTATGGEGYDTFVGSSDSAAGDTLKGNGGDDTFNMGAGNLSYLDTIDGGAGTDTVKVLQDVSDVDFMNVSNAEVLTIDEAGTSTNVLGAYFNSTGITKVNLDTDNVSTISAAGSSGDITYVLGGDLIEDITAGLGNDTFVVSGNGGTEDMKSDDVINGGAGTDIIQIDNSAAAVKAEINIGDKVSNIEKVVVKDADGSSASTAQAVEIIIDGGGIAGVESDNSTDNTDVSIEIDASVITDTNDTTTITLSDIADKDYSFTVKGAASVDTVSGSGVVDTIFGNGGADSIDGAAGDDVIDGGAGNDSITGGTGQDTLTGGAGNDKFLYAIGSSQSTVAKPDTITDLTTGTDTIRLSITTAVSTTYDYTNKGEVANSSEAIEKLSGVIGQYVFDTTAGAMKMEVDNNGLLQATDFGLKITGASKLNAADVNFDIITTNGGTGAIITTGGGADTFDLKDPTDKVTAGAGNDKITLNNLTYDSTGFILGEGTDTVAVAGTATTTALNSTKFSGFEKVTLADDVNLILDPSTLNAFNSATAPTVTGTGNAASANESVKATAATAGNIDISSITFSTDANAILIGNTGANTLTASNGDDYLKGAAAVDKLLGKAGNDTYDLAETTSANIIVESASQGTDTLLVDLNNATVSTQKFGTTVENAAVGGSLANFEQIVLGDNDDATFLATNLTGATIKVATGGDNANVVTLGYTATTAQTVDLSGITGVAALSYTASTGDTAATTTAFGGNAGDKILHDPGDLRDTITLSPTAGILDVITVEVADSAYTTYDIITGFNPAKDSFKMHLAGTNEGTVGGGAVAGANIGSVKAANGKITIHASADGTGAAVAIDSVAKLTDLLGHLHGTAGYAAADLNFFFETEGDAGVGTFLVQGDNGAAGNASYVFLAGVTGITDTHATTGSATQIAIAAI